MLSQFPSPIVSRVSIAVRHLLLPTLILTVAACDSSENPTAPVGSPASALASRAGFKGQPQILVTSGSPQLDLYLADPVTSDVAQLTTGPDEYSVGSWSADFSKIVFVKGLLGGLWIMDADGSNETQVLAMPARGSVFAPDGKSIAFISDILGSAQVYTVDIATHQVKHVTNLPGILLRVSWSLDGKKLLFTRQDGTSSNLFTIAPDGTDLKQITRCIKLYCRDGQFSPDGTQIAFTHGGQIATMSANGGKLKMITSVKEPWANWPTWSPSGDQLAYERVAVGYNNDIWVVDLVTGTKKAVMTSRLDDTTPNWSR
jgi:Tol biopolymer transport system component